MADIVSYQGNESLKSYAMQHMNIYRYTIIPDIPIVNGASSAELVIPVPSYMELHGIRCQSESVKYTLSFRVKKGTTAPNIYEVYTEVDINKVLNIDFTAGTHNVGIMRCINQEVPKVAEIYLIISNNSAAENIEKIFLELILGDI